VVLGGDFNAPQGDAVFRCLTPRLHDAFREGGRGWGDTITNDVPFLRIDQVWVSRVFRAVSVVTRRTRHSDHRFVVCDLTIRRDRNKVPTIMKGLFTEGRSMSRMTFRRWLVRGKTDAPSILLLHGNGGSRGKCLDRAKILSAEGCTVLLVSLWAHGDSTGEFRFIRRKRAAG
jgi:hypothetical protein